MVVKYSSSARPVLGEHLKSSLKRKFEVRVTHQYTCIKRFVSPMLHLMERNGISSTAKRVASLAYARIQGNATFIDHFQNSSLMNEDKRYRPILFNTDGPNAGDQVAIFIVLYLLLKRRGMACTMVVGKVARLKWTPNK
ncbi:hypothetical protein RHSIM_Rhsim03G0121400 [Rhododendron simsii]|uniref:Uncharacterized protein n=1 Tax=Rhododendron simsii TaxID=118357 RepID=A0A834H6L9_RHOSS|nr:hypothetical protein RHSIM_Rhsim03G0121400 [Rhododendron simsii]